MIEWWGRDNCYFVPKKETILIWHSNNGKSYKIEEMDTGHIQNCIVRITKLIGECNYYKIGTFQIHGYTGWQWIDKFKSELVKRNVICPYRY